MDQKSAKASAQEQELTKLRQQVADLDEEKHSLTAKQRKVAAEAAKAAHMPEKAAKQLELVVDMHALTQRQHNDALKTLQTKDDTLQVLAACCLIKKVG